MYLGIDLGTSNSAIAGNIDSQLRLFKTSDGSDVLPSVIYIDRRGHKLYGKRAYEQTVLSPDNVARGFKRLMGTSSVIEFKASGQKLTPEECSAEILRQLVGQAILEANSAEITGTAVTIPAAFNQMQSEATLRAANAAGLENVVLLQEPIAAAMAAMTQFKNRSGQFLVFDLGGGTFDLALVQSLSGIVNIIGHEGINMLGGQDFDRTIINGIVRPWLVDNFALPENFQKEDRYRRLIGKAMIAAELAKIDLSTAERATIFRSDEDIQVKDDDGADIYLDIPITRAQLEELIEPSLMRTIELTRSIIKANGYGNQDIDRIVFVGGPTKMPWIRDRVPRELGIPSDMSIDPMTAVALGAAIYAESREWDATKTKRKAMRASSSPGVETGLKFDYPARLTSDTAKLRVSTQPQAIAARLAIQVDNPATGWTSGRVPLSYDLAIDLPTRDIGEHRFQITFYDDTGLPSADQPTVITIVRTHASAAAIPATQTISVKVRSGATRARNVLQPLILKGTPLPAKGTYPLHAAYGIGPKSPGHIDVELFQDEGAVDADLNLAIGSLRIAHTDLPEGAAIKEGDPIIFHWAMDDNGLLTAAVELPSVRQTLSDKRFYVDQAGHRSFDGEAGEKLVAATIGAAEADAAEVADALGIGAKTELGDVERKLEEQRRQLHQASTGDERRSIAENVRHIRQETARIKAQPDLRGRVLEHRLHELVKSYNESARPSEPTPESRRFDEQAASALNELRQQTAGSLDRAEVIIDQMQTMYVQALWRMPDVIQYVFNEVKRERHLAADKSAFDLLVADGENALAAGDIDELRVITWRILGNQMVNPRPRGNIGRLASVLRGGM